MNDEPNPAMAPAKRLPSPLRLAPLGAVVDLMLILLAATIDRLAPRVRER